MKDKNNLRRPKIFGSTTVGPRGQVVIPVNARQEMGIDAGTTLLVFKALGGQGLVLLKVDAIVTCTPKTVPVRMLELR